MNFFALSLPNAANQEQQPEDASPDDPACRVFECREDALKALKTNKNSRLKTFSTREAAVNFASEVFEPPTLTVGSEVEDLKPSSSGSPVTGPSSASGPPSGEGCLYKGLTPQELKLLKDSIMKEDYETFERLVNLNPRYLMTPCDTPSVIHSGTRSNALHVAAASGSLKMTQKIIDAIQDPQLMIRMYPNETAESRIKRQEYLFDMYLNTPKKGDFDTPLHQASKYGHLDVVKLLASFSSCDSTRINKEGLTPAEVACTRARQPIDVDIKNGIIEAFSNHVYIPVYRTMDSSMPAYVGDPWSPSKASSTEFLVCDDSSNLHNSPMPPKHLGRSPMRSPLLVAKSGNGVGNLSGQTLLSPRTLTDHGEHADPLKSPLTVRALLGPLSPIEAVKLQQEWKKTSSASKILRLTDPHKGLERQGRDLARKYKTRMVEFWDFLNSYADFTTEEGLEQLELHLKAKVVEFEEEESRKFLELENYLAELNIDASPDTSYSASNKGTFTTDLLASLPNLNRPQEIWNKKFDIIEAVDDVKPQPAKLPDSILWNQPRQPANCSSLNSTDLDDTNNDSTNDSWMINNGLKDRSISNESLNSFHSAASSLNDSMTTADMGMVVFLDGLRPTLTDCQVYRALENAIVNREKFPNVHAWMNVVGAYSESDRKKWKPLSAKEKKPDTKSKFVDPKKLTFDD